MCGAGGEENEREWGKRERGTKERNEESVTRTGVTESREGKRRRDKGWWGREGRNGKHKRDAFIKLLLYVHSNNLLICTVFQQELDEATLNGLIKDTNVLQTKEYSTWKWNLLCSMLQHPGLKSSQLVEDTLFAK